MSRAFPYPMTMPALTFVTAVAVASFVPVFMAVLMNSSWSWTGALTALIFVTVLVVYGSPLFTQHVVTETELRIRYGLVFRADISLCEVELARPAEPDERIRGALDLSTEMSRRVVVFLKARRRFPHALFRSSRTVVVSANDVEGLVKAIASPPAYQRLAP